MSQTRSELSQHWPIVLGAGVALGCGYNQMQYVSSIFVKALEAEFGWTRGEIAAGGAALLLGIIAAPMAGFLIDRYGPRPITMIAATLLGLTFVGLSLIPSDIFVYYVLIGVMAVVGKGTTPMGYTLPVVKWFTAQRGVALSLTLVGTSAVALGLGPLLTWLTTDYGFRAGYVAMAVVSWIAIPSVFFLVRDGGRVTADHPKEAVELPGLTLREAAKSYRFYLLFFVLFLVCSAVVAVASQLVPIITDAGFSPEIAGLTITVFATSTVIGRVGIGFAFDRMWAPLPAMLALVPAVFGCLLLMEMPGAWAVYVAAAMLGIAQGVEVDIVSYFISKYFGIKSYSKIFAIVGLAFTFGTVTGQVSAGQAYDYFQNYNAVLIAAAVGFGMSAVLVLLMGRYPDTFAPQSKQPQDEAALEQA
ncbi:MAG: MFS transporter [Gammaproteobacteria bacterium]